MRVAFYTDLPGTAPTLARNVSHVPNQHEIIIIDGELYFVSTRIWEIHNDADPVAHVYLSKKGPEGRTMNERENPNG